ncbi:chorismate synthase [Cerasicoccus frondis]|uniref:chorismate synthase n=1 Tax=Cerasicoccus frondis TaxID=490090 RepID=UPI002852B589|nr:chorismate synthase [Cerasicoccus frondis]
MGNVFGSLFRIATWGESHGGGIGVVIDGCPPRLPLSEADVQFELDRRRPGQSDITTPRKETDTATIVSGVYEGLTLGTPIAVTVPNADHRPEAYAEMKAKFRPSHADFTYQTKYGIRNHEGGGRSSARETIGRVAAGAIAKKILRLGPDQPVEICAYIERVHNISIPGQDGPDGPTLPFPTLEQVEASAVRCPDPEVAEQMIARIKEARSEGDSVGGVIVCRVRGLPVGLGSPVFDRLEADLAKAMLSLPATKGFEVGSGFGAVGLTGREHNDRYVNRDGEIHTETNRSGGVQGGISNGEELYFRVAFKPTATIIQNQATVDLSGQETELMGRGRHDPCVVPRAVPIVESMTALVIVDHWMRHQGQCGTFSFA